jgi:hypothetical protein
MASATSMQTKADWEQVAAHGVGTLADLLNIALGTSAGAGHKSAPSTAADNRSYPGQPPSVAAGVFILTKL